MGVSENPHKVANIVAGQADELAELYLPRLQAWPHTAAVGASTDQWEVRAKNWATRAWGHSWMAGVEGRNFSKPRARRRRWSCCRRCRPAWRRAWPNVPAVRRTTRCSVLRKTLPRPRPPSVPVQGRPARRFAGPTTS